MDLLVGFSFSTLHTLPLHSPNTPLYHSTTLTHTHTHNSTPFHSTQDMCHHHFDVMDGEEDGQSQTHVTDNAEKEDSFEIPGTRADHDESKAADHASLEHEHTPFYSYHAEKALKLVRLSSGNTFIQF